MDNEPKDKVPVSVFFFSNGMAAVCNDAGEQIPQYQGRHHETVKSLEHDGYDWAKLREVRGSPLI